MTPIETLKRLAELQKEATPGPWEKSQYSNYTGWSISAKDRGCIAERWYDNPQHAGYSSEEMASNAALIAQSGSTDFAALAEYVEGLRAAVRDLSGYGDDPCAMPDELKIKHGIF